MFPEFTNPALILKLSGSARFENGAGVHLVRRAQFFFFFTNGLRTSKSHSWKVKLKKKVLNHCTLIRTLTLE